MSKNKKAEQLYAGSPCPAVGKEWEYDERDPELHNFVRDFDTLKDAKKYRELVLGFHCTKCGLTIKYKKNE